jgi:hypothetical protein
MPPVNELQRREYLQAMGITQYVPRWILPGAKVSMLIETSMRVEAPMLAEMPLSEPPSETLASPRVLETVVTGLVESLVPTRKNIESPPEKVVPTESESVPPFTLSIWRPSAALMVLDARPSGQALPTQALLHNILRAKGIESLSGEPDVQRWPPMAGQPAGTWAAVHEMTLAFLQARLELQPAAYLWLMGESAYRAVVADGKSYADSLGQALNLEALGTLALVLPSLSDMLRQPQLKAITWSAIRPHHVG